MIDSIDERSGSDRLPDATADADTLWQEHGWALSGVTVVALVGSVLLASAVNLVAG